MEDGVTENEKLQVFEDEKEGAKDVINNGDQDVEEKPVGFINQLFSNFTPGGKEREEQEIVLNNKVKISNQEEETTTTTRDKERNDNGGDVEEKPIGLINQIISSFNPEDKQDEKEISKAGVESEEKEEEEKIGGIFSHIMPNLEKDGSGRGGDGDGGGGIIDNIVSNLPTPLPDDAAPASDEASILIHSIIHD